MSFKTILNALFILSHVVFVFSHSGSECNVRSSGCSETDTQTSPPLNHNKAPDYSTKLVDTDSVTTNSVVNNSDVTSSAAVNSTEASSGPADLADRASEDSYDPFKETSSDSTTETPVTNSTTETAAVDSTEGTGTNDNSGNKNDVEVEAPESMNPETEDFSPYISRNEHGYRYDNENIKSQSQDSSHGRRLGNWPSYFDRKFYMIPESYQRYGRYERLFDRNDFTVTADIKQRYLGTLEVKMKVVNWIDWSFTVDVGTGYVRSRTFLSRTNNYASHEIMVAEDALSYILERADLIEVGYRDEIKFTVTSDRTSVAFR